MILGTVMCWYDVDLNILNGHQDHDAVVPEVGKGLTTEQAAVPRGIVSAV